MTEYRGAALIVGSLWWDTIPTRVNWRDTRLDMENKQTVYAPIRYGKKSNSWGDTYTMVFSQLCYRNTYGLGTALLVPYQKTIKTADELIQEASGLWKAEAKQPENTALAISATWGAVGMLTRPNVNFPNEIIQRWASHYQNQRTRLHLVQSKTERPIIDENGLLDIRWLTNVDGNQLDEIDFILATATKPTLENKRYPSAKVIAEAWRNDKDNNVRYFTNNRNSNITTFQDEKILKFLQIIE